MKKNVLIRGALCMAMGIFAVKLLGAVYRIPLVNLIGAEGLGLYQMIFPVYAVLLDFSGASLPNALSKIISSYPEAEREIKAEYVLNKSVKAMRKIGIFGSLIMIAASYPISYLQGSTKAFFGYLTLSPSVFFVSVISCYRGYFQGKSIMKHTATSQVLESTTKLVLGLAFAYFLMPNLPLAVAGATLAVTLGEAVTLLYLYLRWRSRKTPTEIKGTDTDDFFSKILFKTALPITLTGIAIPFSHFLDSFIIVNALPFTKEYSTALYGILSGVVNTVISLPVGLCYGIAVSSIPSVSALKTQAEKSEGMNKSIIYTGVSALLLALLTFVFAPTAVNILFSALSPAQKAISVRLLRLTSPCILFLSLVQTTNALLVATDKYYFPLLGLGCGIAVKTMLSLVLIPNSEINIYGGGIALIACYFVAVMVNFTVILKKGAQNAVKTPNDRKNYAVQ